MAKKEEPASKPSFHKPSFRVAGLQTVADLKKANDGFAKRAKKKATKAKK